MIPTDKVWVKVKRMHDDARLPNYETDGAAGFDFKAYLKEPITIHPMEAVEIPFGIALEIPEGYSVTIRSRSGLAFKHQVIAYHGLIDSDYRGELSVLLINFGKEDFVVKNGDRVAQGKLEVQPRAMWQVGGDLSETKRGEKGFGSTGV